jgi:probable F420-dependent oxidoreductase
MSATTKPLEFSPFKLSPHGRWGGIGPIVEATKLADELGFYSINMPEHVILPQDPAAPLEDVWYDNFVIASHLAAVTKRIRFLLYVMIIPYHEPIVAAKQLATLDQVTNGRVICGTGVGWLKGELEALGVSHEKRGAITDEYLEAMRELWTQDTASYDGKYVNFANMSFNPKCVQTPHVPLWIGGTGPAARHRSVALGDGWMPMSGALEDIEREVDAIKEMLTEAGRDPKAFNFSSSISVGEPDSYTPHASASQHLAHTTARSTSRNYPWEAEAVIDGIVQMREAGFNHIFVRLSWENPLDLMRRMEWFASSVMPAFKTVAASG